MENTPKKTLDESVRVISPADQPLGFPPPHCMWKVNSSEDFHTSALGISLSSPSNPEKSTDCSSASPEPEDSLNGQ